jgi:hypothetical protein
MNRDEVAPIDYFPMREMPSPKSGSFRLANHAAIVALDANDCGKIRSRSARETYSTCC